MLKINFEVYNFLVDWFRKIPEHEKLSWLNTALLYLSPNPDEHTRTVFLKESPDTCQAWARAVLLADLVSKLRIGMTRTEVKGVLGEPTDFNVGTRKYKRPTVYKYGDVELVFEYPEDGGLIFVYVSRLVAPPEEGAPLYLLQEPSGSSENIG